MATQLSTIFANLQAQQFPALITILEKGQEFAQENTISEEELVKTRLTEDMHPLSWQVQTVCEMAVRAAARLSGQTLPSLEFNETTLAGLVERVKEVQKTLQGIDAPAINANSDSDFEIPIGPDASLTLSGEDYVLKFFLPNFYFHLTTVYALLRKHGVDVGKRDYMGPVTG